MKSNRTFKITYISIRDDADIYDSITPKPTISIHYSIADKQYYFLHSLNHGILFWKKEYTPKEMAEIFISQVKESMKESYFEEDFLEEFAKEVEQLGW